VTTPDTQQERMAKILAFVEATLPDLKLYEWQRQFVLNLPEEMPDLRVDKRSRREQP
jgi:hypothetical protein